MKLIVFNIKISVKRMELLEQTYKTRTKGLGHVPSMGACRSWISILNIYYSLLGLKVVEKLVLKGSFEVYLYESVKHLYMSQFIR